MMLLKHKVFFYEGGDEQALVVFRDPDEAEAEVPGTGMTCRILGDTVGADEQLQPRRSGRNQPRDLHEEEEFESEADSDYEEEQIPFEDDEDEILGANSFED